MTLARPATLAAKPLARVPRASLAAIAAVAVLGGVVALVWRDLIDIHQPFDPLLAGLWVGMTLLLAWGVKLRRDLILAFSASCGGLLIEWWGTSTDLWTYFTGERPPLWIVPAWPVAALATERITRLLERALPQRGTWIWRLVQLTVLGAFVVGMLRFMAPSWTMTASKVVLAIMLVVTVTSRTPRRDLALFVAGSALGWLLEYWGTTRNCWTYYTLQTPPLITAFAHGFATVAFGRAAAVLDAVLTRLTPRKEPAPRQEPAAANQAERC
jgi:hypothetical protein